MSPARVLYRARDAGCVLGFRGVTLNRIYSRVVSSHDGEIGGRYGTCQETAYGDTKLGCAPNQG
jgi:hypothetical protein